MMMVPSCSGGGSGGGGIVKITNSKQRYLRRGLSLQRRPVRSHTTTPTEMMLAPVACRRRSRRIGSIYPVVHDGWHGIMPTQVGPHVRCWKPWIPSSIIWQTATTAVGKSRYLKVVPWVFARIAVGLLNNRQEFLQHHSIRELGPWSRWVTLKDKSGNLGPRCHLCLMFPRVIKHCDRRVETIVAVARGDFVLGLAKDSHWEALLVVAQESGSSVPKAAPVFEHLQVFLSTQKNRTVEEQRITPFLVRA